MKLGGNVQGYRQKAEKAMQHSMAQYLTHTPFHKMHSLPFNRYNYEIQQYSFIESL